MCAIVFLAGAPLAQLVECRTLDRKVAGSNLARGAVLCPLARHLIFIAYYWKRPDMTEEMLAGTLNLNPNKKYVGRLNTG